MRKFLFLNVNLQQLLPARGTKAFQIDKSTKEVFNVNVNIWLTHLIYFILLLLFSTLILHLYFRICSSLDSNLKTQPMGHMTGITYDQLQ